MKHFLKFGVLLATGASVLTISLSGCASNATNSVVTNSNWFTGTSYAGIQPSFILDEEHPEYTKEEISYDVTFDGEGATNSSYSVEYENGTFTTQFYGTKYDWNDVKPEGYKKDEVQTVYYYRTKLNIRVKYTLKDGGAESDWFNDSVITESYFRSAGDNLKPIYSIKTINSTSPKARTAKTLEDAYSSVNAVYENYYSYDCDEVTSYITIDGEERESKVVDRLDRVKTSLFDNSYLYIAARSMKLSDDFSQSISLYSAERGEAVPYILTGNSTHLSDDESAHVTAELERAKLFTPSEDVKAIPTAAVNVNYTGEDLQGAYQTVWYAAITDADLNTARATMLKISMPLGYNLGRLVYVLKEVNTTLWSE